MSGCHAGLGAGLRHRVSRMKAQIRIRFHRLIILVLQLPLFANTHRYGKAFLCISCTESHQPLPDVIVNTDAGTESQPAFVRMIQVRHRSHATYSRQPRQVRKEATVTGSCVCSGPPVPGLLLLLARTGSSGSRSVFWRSAFSGSSSLYTSFTSLFARSGLARV